MTNDKFRDYIDGLFELIREKEGEKPSPGKKSKKGSPKGQSALIMDKTSAKNEQTWIKSHSISYTFNKDEFLPNPDSKIW